MTDMNIEKVVEALLFSSDKPLALNRIQETLDGVDAGQIKEALEKLNEYYRSNDRSFEVAEIAGGYQLVTKKEYSVWLSKMYKKVRDKIRGASMETLAIIVYKQPVTKAEIEAIRGVNVDGVLKTLIDKDLVKIKGRKDSPGRPIIYGTTEEFLIRFGLKDLKSLPPLKEFTEGDLEYAKELQELDTGESIEKEGDVHESEGVKEEN